MKKKTGIEIMGLQEYLEEQKKLKKKIGEYISKIRDNTEKKMLPCPFCGERISVDVDVTYSGFIGKEPTIDEKLTHINLIHPKNGCIVIAAGILYGHTLDEVVEKWNRRV